MTDSRDCLRACVRRGVHFATCTTSGTDYVGLDPCRGCAPAEAAHGALVCSTCLGRIRGLMGDARDLLARLRALADPLKATPFDTLRVQSSRGEPSLPVPADLHDAMATVILALSVWDQWNGDLTELANKRDPIVWLSEMVLDRHAPVDGIRERWSVQDAADQWSVERRDRTPALVEDDDVEVVVTPVSEWGNPLMSRAQAEHLAGSPRTLQRWVKAGDLVPASTTWVAGQKVTLFRTDDVERVRDEKRKVGIE